MSKKAWKILKKGMKSMNGDVLWKVGEWQKVEGELVACSHGLHASKLLPDAMNYVTPGIIAHVEYRGDVLVESDKICAREMRVVRTYRFTKKMAVAYAIWCAKRSLSRFEQKYPDDDRPRKAIEAAERVLCRDTQKNRSAAKSAAWSAESAACSARSAAKSAVWSAESAACSARSAAKSAVWSAAKSAESAACSAAKSAESAAWSAACSARSAAKSAVWSAAWSAESARSAAKSAEKRAQHRKLLQIIGAKNDV